MIRNQLFEEITLTRGPPGAGGFDLAALNMQRGRDHGLPGFNDARRDMGIRPLRDFRSLTRDRDTLEALESVYQNVDQLDLWVAGLCEEDVPESMVGRIYHELIVDQFTRLRDGDRFYYEAALPEELVRLVNDQTLARIIRRNTEIGDELPDNLFVIGGDRRQREQDRERSRVPRSSTRR